MKRLLIYFSLILYTSSLLSCHKDKDSSGQSDQLAKILIMGSANPSKSVRAYEFIYDDNNRVSEISYSTGDIVNGQLQVTDNRRFTCSYNGAEKAPYATKGFYSPGASPDEAVYHFYDNKGALLKDSLTALRTNPAYIDYSYSNNYIMIKNTNVYSSMSTPIIPDSLIIANHNIIANYFPGNTVIYGTQYSYDNKINPLSRLNISSFLVNEPLDYTITPGYCSNNVTASDGGMFTNGQWTSSGGVSYQLSYTYNDKELPVECKVTSNITLPYTIKFYYK